MGNPFTELSQPGHIGNLRLKNRIIMAPAGTNYSNPDGSVTEWLLKHYQQRGRGGAALVIVEFAFVDNKGSKSLHGQLGIYDDQLIPGLSLLARVIQDGGARAGIQIVHGGLERFRIGTYPAVAPSRVGKEYLGGHEGVFPKELTIEEIQEIVSAFGQAALRAKKAGFDMVELHGAHGYLINQFLSSYTNRRNDMYGGTLEDRMRFPLEVVTCVRQTVGVDYPVGIRINGMDYVDGGVTIKEAKIFAKELEKRKISVIHVSAGLHRLRSRAIEPMLLPVGNKIWMAAEVKSVVNLPIIASGSIVTPDIAEEVLKEKKADFVSMARPLIADPELPKKSFEGRSAEIRPCIRCNEGCLERGTFTFQQVKCTVNVAVGFEEWVDMGPANKRSRVLIVGAGPAGMEAAVTAAQKGHEVTLVEKREALGGALIEASFPDFKKDLRRLIDYYSYQLQKYRIKTIMGKEATIKDIQEGNYESVILATGSKLVVPNVPGVGGENVTNCLDVLKGKEVSGNDVIVIGGGYAGCEVALFLAEGRKKVTIVAKSNEVGAEIDSLTKEVLFERLAACGVDILTGLELTEIRTDGIVTVDIADKEVFVKGQEIILAKRFFPDESLYDELYSRGMQVYKAGDCVEPRKIYDAIHEGNRAARNL